VPSTPTALGLLAGLALLWTTTTPTALAQGWSAAPAPTTLRPADEQVSTAVSPASNGSVAAGLEVDQPAGSSRLEQWSRTARLEPGQPMAQRQRPERADLTTAIVALSAALVATFLR
jgi:hypothetical protein